MLNRLSNANYLEVHGWVSLDHECLHQLLMNLQVAAESCLMWHYVFPKILEHRCCCIAVSSNFTSNTKRSGKNPGACGGCKKDAQVLERQTSISRLLASLLLGIMDPSDPEKSFARHAG